MTQKADDYIKAVTRFTICLNTLQTWDQLKHFYILYSQSIKALKANKVFKISFQYFSDYQSLCIYFQFSSIFVLH